MCSDTKSLITIRRSWNSTQLYTDCPDLVQTLQIKGNFFTRLSPFQARHKFQAPPCHLHFCPAEYKFGASHNLLRFNFVRIMHRTQKNAMLMNNILLQRIQMNSQVNIGQDLVGSSMQEYLSPQSQRCHLPVHRCGHKPGSSPESLCLEFFISFVMETWLNSWPQD